jgi:hypothetical protein
MKSLLDTQEYTYYDQQFVQHYRYYHLFLPHVRLHNFQFLSDQFLFVYHEHIFDKQHQAKRKS